MSDLWPLCSLWGNWLGGDHKSLWTSPTQVASTGAGGGSTAWPRRSAVRQPVEFRLRKRQSEKGCRSHITCTFIWFAVADLMGKRRSTVATVEKKSRQVILFSKLSHLKILFGVSYPAKVFNQMCCVSAGMGARRFKWAPQRSTKK